MLADTLREIAAMGRHPLTGRLEPEALAPFVFFRQALDGAHHFALDDDIVRAAHQVVRASPTSLVSALPLARLPFGTTWIEWSETRRAELRDADGETVRHDRRRMGALVVADEGLQSGMMHFAIELADRTIRPVVVATLFDFSRPGSMADFEQNRRWTRDEIRAETALHPYARRWADKDAEVEALLGLYTTTHHAMPHWARALMNRHALERGQAYADAITQGALDEIQGAPYFVMAAVALMNSRNLVETAPEKAPDELARLNAKRRKRGAPPLYSFSTVKISLSKIERARGRRPAAQSQDIRAHLVRGHFKVRKSGIFWWSPHLRGDPRAGFADKDYSVIS